MLKRSPRTNVAARVGKLTPPRQRALRPAGCQVLLGRLVGWDAKGPLVDFEGNRGAPVSARLAGLAPGVRVVPPAATGQEVVLLVDPRPGRAPVVLGLVQPIAADPAASSSEIEARVDGRRIELDGRDEIILRCGEASITLRRNGRVLIRGVQVETRASGTNRIKGGSVAIN